MRQIAAGVLSALTLLCSGLCAAAGPAPEAEIKPGAAACKTPEELREAFPPDFFKCPGCSVLFIDVDGLRADRFGAYGERSRSSTPFLDSLARKAVVFRHATAQSNWTYPSLGSIVTSQYASTHRIGETSAVISTSLPTLFSTLGAEGYRLFGDDTRPMVLSKDMLMKSEDYSFENPDYASRFQAAFDVGASSRAMIYLLNMDLHFPYGQPRGFDAADRAATARLHLGAVPGASRASIAALNRIYDRRVRAVDGWLKELFSGFDRKGLKGRTIVFLFSNHGEELGDHALWGHGYGLFDQEVQVPLLLLHPRINAGNAARICPEVQLIDLGETALDMLGLKNRHFGEGRSLVPLMTGRSGGEAYAFSERLGGPTYDHRAMARTLDWKLISTSGGAYRLYDLKADPAEQRDVGEGNEALVREMKAALERWEKSKGPAYPPGKYEQTDAEKAFLRKNGYW